MVLGAIAAPALAIEGSPAARACHGLALDGRVPGPAAATSGVVAVARGSDGSGGFIGRGSMPGRSSAPGRGSAFGRDSALGRDSTTGRDSAPGRDSKPERDSTPVPRRNPSAPPSAFRFGRPWWRRLIGGAIQTPRPGWRVRRRIDAGRKWSCDLGRLRNTSGAFRPPMIPQAAGPGPLGPARVTYPSTTYSSRGASFSSIAPSRPQMTMSSMRAPYSPGR